jgi:hypothetical protein
VSTILQERPSETGCERVHSAPTPRPLQEPLQGGGGHPTGAGGDHGDGGGGRRQWPLLPALAAAGLVGALLTFLGMLTQIWANMAGAQLPGA